MEELLEQLKGLDNVQLRAELLKHGEKVGPVTPTTRKLFLNKLAKKMYLAEHPEAVSSYGDSPSCPSISTKDSDQGSQTQKSAGPMSQTPTGRRGSGRNSEDRDEACVYYIVILADSSTDSANPNSASEYRVFTERLEALAFMKKNTGSRLKIFHNSTDVKQFMAQPSEQVDEPSTISSSKPEEPSNNNLAADAEKSAFKGPKIQELVQFRKLVEKGDVDRMKATVWSNPRYLMTGADTPVILHEGMRHNLLHIAARANQASVAKLLLDTVLDPEFTKLLYNSSRDTEESRQRRIVYLVDLYLNSPDKGAAETPLHIACKMGHKAVVECLVMFSVTDRTRSNKYGEKPADVICSRCKGNQSGSTKREIQELLKGLCLVPLLRSVDNITVPVVGAPCSPDDRLKLRTPSTSLSLTGHSLRQPELTLSAYAGPMSPSKARDFQKQWMNPRRLTVASDAQEITSARRSDAEKGYERIGRKLARDLCVPWTEYWQFLDAFADFSTVDGLQKLEQHLGKQQAVLTIQSAVEQSSDSDCVGCTSSDDSDGQSDEEQYYSCEEVSVNEGNEDNSVISRHSARMVEIAAHLEDDNDVFEDSLDDFFDTQGYIFGQRLQLKKSNNNNKVQHPDKESKAACKSAVDVSRSQEKCASENDVLWSYRDTADHEQVEKKALESFSNDSTNSIDACSPSSDEKCSGSTVDRQEEGQKIANQAVPRASTETLEKSFNTVMTELSDDMETKLIFSPEGKVMTSRRGHIIPDVGLCVGKNVFKRGQGFRRRGKCPLDIVLKSKRGNLTFLADVLVHPMPSDSDSDEDFSDESFESQAHHTRHQILKDVKVVARNAVVFEYMQHIVRPVHLTVGILEPGCQDVADNYGCVTARIVRRKRSNLQQTACYIYGKSACKTDLDVMRAMLDTKVDSTVFPAVHSWLTLVTETQDDRKSSWPSPAKLRHQHRLSQLHKSSPGSPLPISPLVQGGTTTSTPVSHISFPPVLCNRDLSPERLAPNTPRVWLFKSPT